MKHAVKEAVATAGMVLVLIWWLTYRVLRHVSGDK